jgi:hypothetical protein
MGSGKQYEGIAGCLIAYTAREALKKYGGLAGVSLKPKQKYGSTILINMA